MNPLPFHCISIARSPKVFVATPDYVSPLFTLQHISSQITQFTSTGCATGASVWCAHLPQGDAFIAFDWYEMRERVALLTDPNSMISNFCFTDETGQEAPLLSQIVSLARIVHNTAWQPVAVALADQRRVPQAPLSRHVPSAYANAALSSSLRRHQLLRRAA